MTRPLKVLTFSGYEWDVRDIPRDRGGPNDYDPDNAWTDAKGLLHLKLGKRDGRWTSAEVILRRGLGHGTYSFTVGDVESPDQPAVRVDSRQSDEAAKQLASDRVFPLRRTDRARPAGCTAVLGQAGSMV